jgi:hypothetical protein
MKIASPKSVVLGGFPAATPPHGLLLAVLEVIYEMTSKSHKVP